MALLNSCSLAGQRTLSCLVTFLCLLVCALKSPCSSSMTSDQSSRSACNSRVKPASERVRAGVRSTREVLGLEVLLAKQLDVLHVSYPPLALLEVCLRVSVARNRYHQVHRRVVPV